MATLDADSVPRDADWVSRLSFSIQVENLRTFERATLLVDGLRVLIGDNGTGKSTLVEATELLRQAAVTQNFGVVVDQYHRGVTALARDSASEVLLTVGVNDSDADRSAVYQLGFRRSPLGIGTELAHEEVLLRPRPGHAEPFRVLERNNRGTRLYIHGRWEPVSLSPTSTLLGYVYHGTVNGVHPELIELARHIASIQVHLPWEITPLWLAASRQRKSSLRTAQILLAEQTLAPLGDNFVSVLHHLKNGSVEVWNQFLGLVRMGLELPVENVNVKLGAEGGMGVVALKLSSRDAELSAATLSDGQLAWIAWSALLSNPSRPSLLVLDEPDLHMHPALARRFVAELEVFANDTPVLVATHSDTLLDSLSDPAEQTVPLVSTDVGTSIVGRLDAASLEKWREEYSGVGELRRQGMLAMFTRDADVRDISRGDE